MFLYEELNYEQIVNNPQIDPDSADALYARAQCCKNENGIAYDYELYKELLVEAASKGNENAIQELHMQENKEFAIEPIQEEQVPDLQNETLERLCELEKNDDVYACVELSKRCEELGDTSKKEYFLKRSEECANMIQDYERKNALFIFLADSVEDLVKQRHYLEYARELGSINAAYRLIEIYEEGVGGEVDMDGSKDCITQVIKRGNAYQRYDVAIKLLDRGSRFEAASVLEELLYDKNNHVDLRRDVARHMLQINPKRFENDTTILELLVD